MGEGLRVRGKVGGTQHLNCYINPLTDSREPRQLDRPVIELARLAGILSVPVIREHTLIPNNEMLIVRLLSVILLSAHVATLQSRA